MPAPTTGPGVLSSTTLGALAAYIDDTRTGVLARGKRTSNSSGATTEIGVLRLDDIPISSGHLIYVCTSAIRIFSTVASDDVAAVLRYTTDGSTPTTSSTEAGRAIAKVSGASVDRGGWVAPSGSYTPAGDETLSVLLSVVRTNGTGTVNLLANMELFIVDLGIDPGDTGTDL